MKKAALLVAGLFYALTLTAQELKTTIEGNGKIITERRDIAEFKKIKIIGPFEVKLISGNSRQITLEGDENILALITTDIDNSTLNITTKNNQYIKASRKNTVKIKIPYTQLENIALIGCGSVTSKGIIKSPYLKATLDGPGSIDLSLSSTEAEAWILGSGTINLNGTSEKLTCKVIGSGIIKAKHLESNEVIANISGSGNINVNSIVSITGKIIGTGNIAFAGEPKQTDLKYLGAASFTKN
ncbi:head GIN domain-containing protein [Flavobacterium sp. NRK1]|uniref:head GIN domain-containing protein n=1 Tax=Flavobacterium sp. NRK1 TaxID=2954929 RepID=UPI002092F129|nr:head GIN domain-containing protein [Flavobacterium sp. NRK1]MCO6149015.1 DUF2807 domain-containing protein [Flavobacterium sp. NRK1]